MRELRALAGLLAAGVPAVVGCAGSLSDPGAYYAAADAGDTEQASDGGKPPNCDAPTTVFDQSCIICHAPPAPLGDLDLASPGLTDRLVDVPSPLCKGQSLVVPGQPDASYLLQKMTEAAPACGSPMPETGTLPPHAISCVSDWISNLTSPGGGETSATSNSTAGPSTAAAGSSSAGSSTDGGSHTTGTKASSGGTTASTSSGESSTGGRTSTTGGTSGGKGNTSTASSGGAAVSTSGSGGKGSSTAGSSGARGSTTSAGSTHGSGVTGTGGTTTAHASSTTA